jgi:hypothetical protein
MIYVLCIGVFIGYAGGLICRGKKIRSVGTQASEIWAQPISIQNLKRNSCQENSRTFGGMIRNLDVLCIKLVRDLVRRLEIVTCEGPKILLGVGSRQLGVDGQRDESHDHEFQ